MRASRAAAERIRSHVRSFEPSSTRRTSHSMCVASRTVVSRSTSSGMVSSSSWAGSTTLSFIALDYCSAATLSAVQGAVAPPAGWASDEASAGAEARRLRRPRASSFTIAVGFLAALGYTAYVLSPRFGIRVPATIDDWYSASQPNASFSQLVDPYFQHTGQRFRPGFQLFDHVMWHTLGAPDMTGP